MFIAEIGINHQGDLNLAKELITMAKNCCVDVVKFQKRNPDKCVPENQKNILKETPWGTMTYLEYKHKIEFNKVEYDQIDLFCKQIGIKWTASVWDEDSVDFLMQYDIPFLKIASACITDTKLLMKIKNTNKPIVLSIGMSNMEEVINALNILKGCDVTILHCNSNYPSVDNELDLNVISSLKKIFNNYTIGYSGHEIGIMPTILASALGAEVIERHITLDKNMWGSDHKASLIESELRELINNIKNIPIWLGDCNVKCYPSEEKIKQKLRILS